MADWKKILTELDIDNSTLPTKTWDTIDVNNADSGYTWGTDNLNPLSIADTLDLVAGGGISLSTDTTNKAIKIDVNSTFEASTGNFTGGTISLDTSVQIDNTGNSTLGQIMFKGMVSGEFKNKLLLGYNAVTFDIESPRRFIFGDNARLQATNTFAKQITLLEPTSYGGTASYPISLNGHLQFINNDMRILNSDDEECLEFKSGGIVKFFSGPNVEQFRSLSSDNVWMYKGGNSTLTVRNVDANDGGTGTGNLYGNIMNPNCPNITGIGTITSGTWNATAIADGYIASASDWDAKVDKSGTPATDSYARFNENDEIYGQTLSDLKTTLGITTSASVIDWTQDQGATNISSHNIGVVNSSSPGLAPQMPASHGGKFLKADGTWVVPDYVDTTLSTEEVQDIVGAMFTGNTETRISATYEDGDGTIDLDVDDMTADTQPLTTEEVQDIVGAMFTSNTETRISATYEDGDGTIDLVVDDMTADLDVDVSVANLIARLPEIDENVQIGDATDVNVSTPGTVISKGFIAGNTGVKTLTVFSDLSLDFRIDQNADSTGQNFNFYTDNTTLLMQLNEEGKLTTLSDVNGASPSEMVHLSGVTSAIQTQIDSKQDTLLFDINPVDSSNNPVTSNGVFDALATKQNTLIFDSDPTDGSDAPVESGGVYDALELKQDELTFGIANTNALKVDDNSGGVNGEFLKFTASGVESRTATQFRGDILAQTQLTFGISNNNAVKIQLACIENDVAVIGTTGLKGRSYSEFRGDINVEDGADVTGKANVITALNNDLGGNITIGTQTDDTVTFNGPISCDQFFVNNPAVVKDLASFPSSPSVGTAQIFAKDKDLYYESSDGDNLKLSNFPQQVDWIYYYANLSTVDRFYYERWNDEFGVSYSISSQLELYEYDSVLADNWKIWRFARRVSHVSHVRRFSWYLETSAVSTDCDVEVALWKAVRPAEDSWDSTGADSTIAHLCTLTFEYTDGGVSKGQHQSTTSMSSSLNATLSAGDGLFVTVRRTSGTDGAYFYMNGYATLNCERELGI